MPRLPLALLTLTAAALLLAGCAGSGDTPAGPSTPDSTSPSQAPSPSSSAAASPPAAAPTQGTSLTVDFSQDGSTVTATYTLECDGAAPVGDSAAPDPAAACAALAADGAALFAPPATDAMCTQMIKGMQRAHVSGTVNGEAVDADFSLTNGCEISRWEKVAALLGPAEGTL